MRVFLTGGTGFIGSAVVRALVEGGHGVTALNRSAEKAPGLRELGAVPLEGDMAEPSGYGDAASEHDALVHCAFQYRAGTVEADRVAVDTLLAAARASPSVTSVIYTSGCWVLGDTGGEPADEGAAVDEPAEVVTWRPAHERVVLDAGRDGLATAVIRPGMVYGGHGALTGKLFQSAVEEGAAAHVGDGGNHWSLVYRADLARLYRRVIEQRAGGVFHAVDGSPVKVREAARAASEAAGAGGATRSIPLAEARERLGPVADALCLDQELMARRSRELGWSPRQPSFPASAALAFREWRESRNRS